MLFQHTIGLVLSGAKTQTRRLSTHHAGSFYDEHWGAVYNTLTGIPVWVVGKDYAAQPGRGKAAVTVHKEDGYAGLGVDESRQLERLVTGTW